MTTDTGTDATTAKDTTASGQGAEGQDQGQGGEDQAKAQTQSQDQTTATTTDADKGKEGTPDQGQAGADQTDQKAGKKVEQKDAKGQEQKAADYAITIPEGLKADSLTKWFEDHAKAVGMTKEQAQSTYDGWIALKQEAAALAAKDREEAEHTLKQEWQKDFDANMAVAESGMKKLGGTDLAELLKKTGLNNNPVMIRALHRAGKLLSEDSYVNGGSGTAAQGVSKAHLMYPNQGKQ